MNAAFTVPASPSTTVASLMEMAGAASSSTIVPWPWPSAMVALAAPDRFTRNVSLGSPRTSPKTGTETGRLVVPDGNVIVPAWAT